MRNLVSQQLSRWTVAAIVSVVISGLNAWAAENGDRHVDRSEPTLHFQRVMVPAERPEDWPRRSGVRYFPMSADEFEKRIAIAGGKQPLPDGSNSAQLVEAIYRGKLIGQNLVGNAEWKFRRPTAGVADVVILRGCKLPIVESSWSDIRPLAPSDAATSLIVGNDQLGRLVAIVDRSGTINSKWALQPSTQDRELQFDLELPLSPKNIVELTLPGDQVLHTDRGIVSTVEPIDISGTQQKWRVELGGANRVVLRLSKKSQDKQAEIRARQSLHYQFSQQGLELNAELAFETSTGLGRTLKLRLESPLQIVSAALGTMPLEINPSSVGGADGNELLLQLPQPLRGTGQVLTVKALAPIDPGKDFRLPLIEVPDAKWEQSAARLTAKSPLGLADLQLADARQVGTTIVEGSGDQSYDIQFFGEHPAIHLILGRREASISAGIGTSIALRANEGLGHCIAELSASDGYCFNLVADLGPQWMIDNVDSIPSGAVADWSQRAVRDGPTKLRIQLARSIGPNRNLRLSISGRRRRAPWGDTFRADDLAMLRFDGLANIHQLVHVQAIDPYQLQLRGDDNLHRLDLAKLSPTQAELLDVNQAGLLFENDDSARSLTASLTAKSTQFDVDIHCEAIAGGDRLTESYRFAISPRGREISRFSIRFSQPRAEALVWTVDGQSAGTVTARRLPEDPAARPNGGETWEIILPVSRSTPITLTASRRIALQRETPVSLASVLGADSQQGIVELKASGDRVPEIRSTRRIKALSAATDAPSQARALAAFRYDPDEDTGLSIEPPLVLAPGTQLAQNCGAWIWQQQLTSIFAHGVAEHLLVSRVEAAEPELIEFNAIPGAVLQDVLVDGRSVRDSIDSFQAKWPIELPSGKRFVAITLRWTEQVGPTSMLSRHDANWPKCSLPVLARKWTVWLPPDDDLADAHLGNRQLFTLPWTKRLFGPFASTDGATEFAAKIETETSIAKRPSAWGSDSSSNAAHQNATSGAATPSIWKVYQFSDAGDAAMSVHVASHASLAALAWATFFFIGAARWWMGRISIEGDVLSFAVMTAIALAAPTVISTLSAAAWLGLATGRLLVWLSTWLTPSEERAAAGAVAEKSSSRRSTAIAMGLALLVTTICVISRAGDVPQRTGNSSTVAEEPQQVLIPVDANGKSIGGVYFLAESLRRELLQQSAEFDLDPPRYVFTRAVYEPLKLDGSDEKPTDEVWQAQFDIETLANDVAIQLPLGSNGSALLPNQLTVDGKPTEARRTGDGRAIAIGIAAQGSHRVRLAFRPVVSNAVIEFAVPRASSTELDLNNLGAELRLANAVGINAEVATASGDSGDPKNRNTYWLGATDSIKLIRNVTIDAAPQFDADQLNWLHIQPGGSTIDVRLRINVLSGRLQHLDLMADPNLLAAIRPDHPSIASAERLAGEPGVVRLNLAPAISGRRTIDVQFAIANAVAIGRIHLPTIEISGAKRLQQLWAASIDKTSDALISHSNGDATSLSKFMALWGPTPTKPQFAWSDRSEFGKVALDIRPKDVAVEASYKTVLIANRQDACVRTAATITPTGGSLFICHVQVPRQMEVEQATASNDNGEVPVRWTQPHPDRLTFFFENAIEGETTILIQGRMPLLSDGRVTASIPQVEGANTTSTEIAVLREHDALASVLSHGGYQAMNQSYWPSWLDEARREGLIENGSPNKGSVVAILQSNRNAEPPTVNIDRNVPQIAVVQATAVGRTADSWTAVCHLALHVETGIVDTLRCDLPPNWTGPIQVSPKMSSSIETLPGENRRQLVLHPDTPLGRDFNLQIAGPLVVGAGQRVAAPMIRLAGAASQQQFILLPRHVENQQLEWDRRGLVPRPLPESIAKLTGDVQEYRPYEVVADNARAQLKSVDRITSNPQVRLVDIAIYFGQSGRAIGTAAFDIDPADAASCQLIVPIGCQLIRTELDGSAAQLMPLGKQQWTVALGSNKLPRRLEVIYSAAADSQLNENDLPCPTIAGLPIERTLWQIMGPSSEVPKVNESSIRELDHALLRLKSVVSLANGVGGVLVDEPHDDAARWFSQWARRFMQVRFGALLSKDPTTGTDQLRHADVEIDSADQEETQLAQRLELIDLADQISEETPIHDWLEVVPQIAPLAAATAFAVADGKTAITPFTLGTATDAGRLRQMAAVVVLVAAGAFVWARRRGWILGSRVEFGRT